MGSSPSCSTCSQDTSQAAAEVVQASKQTLPEASEVFGPVTSFQSSVEKDSPTLSRLDKFSRLESLAHLEVDEEVLRGIPLHHTLQVGLGQWSSPKEMSQRKQEALYEKSSPTLHFDIFFSHTWLTTGNRKYVALLFHNGWPVMVTSWILATTVLSILCLTDALPMPFSYQASVLDYRQTCPLGCWVIALTLPVACAALVLSPYCPNKLGKHSICFVDMFSIHQTDSMLRERGIYGIGGCLQRSKELRVLWSPPYFSRLWCIFELAAYRFANPQGKITMAPLFVESVVLTLLVGILAVSAGVWVGAALRSMEEYTVLHILLTSIFSSVPLLGIIHVLRKETRAKRQLLLDLESFSLDRAECLSDFDREFIHSAIDKWYGSAEAFAKYVRGPLRAELLQSNAATVPSAYLMTCVISIESIQVELFLALVKGGAPLKCILAVLVGLMIGPVFYQLSCFKLMLKLAEKFAEPCNAILDLLQTFLIWLTTWFLLVICGSATVTLLSRPNVLPLLLLVLFECLVFLAAFGHLPLRRVCLRSSDRA
ncbi:unnamed protein product [Effrenium voratum]|uniref:Uncharacterized protein n=1 Tax=Effrenium voratum TaxID=2562239 RepID=A0AA36MXK9_9DINO|nr:unnamed protein product [Effrenium voratum]CAJ1422468.1 unnamed protein product [Effrenium voratum]